MKALISRRSHLYKRGHAVTRCELHLPESSAWALTDSLSYSAEKPNSELSSQCQSLGLVENSQGLPAKEAEISERLSLQSKAHGRGEVSAWQSGKILAVLLQGFWNQTAYSPVPAVPLASAEGGLPVGTSCSKEKGSQHPRDPGIDR